MSLLGKLFHKKTYLGVDIGTTSIKAVQLTSGKKPELVDYALLESFRHLEKLDDAIQTSSFKMLDKSATEFLKTATENMNLQDTEVIASIQAFSAFVTLLELPLMSAEETGRAMPQQAKQYIPLPLEQVAIDWVKVSEKQGHGGNPIQQVLLVSVPNEIVKKYQNIFQAAGLNLVGLEVEGLSLARALTAGISGLTLILDIGSRSTSILIAEKGLLKFMAQTDFAGSSLTQNLSSGINVSAGEAEALKRKKGLELSTLILPVLDAILNEVRRHKDNFEKNYKEEVRQLVLSGGGANLAGLEKYFASRLGLPVSKANPFSNVSYPSELEPAIQELSPAFATAIGLALRNI